ncbi:MFS transporter [Clostridium estertheticum]|uniref:MFS transporter n=1 Tax=Clostridium estertheticum TaxID=238834 RepID=UPI0013E966FF|nr:MFS transporter [Clostridium estertheticum]MBZ9688161.1 MFS transporter [Clostridium estertheticum]
MKEHGVWSKEYIYICISSFFLFMIFYSQMAVLPLFVTNGLGGSGQQAGLATTMFLIGSVIFRPFAGKWVDELGRKKMLLIGLSLFLVASIMYIEVKNLSSLLILRFIHGIGFALANTALCTVITDLVSEKRRGEGLGYFVTFMNLAMVIGPFLGLTMIAHGSFKLFFITTAIFAVLSFLFGNIVRIPKTLVKGKVIVQEYQGLKRYFEPNVASIAIAGSFVSFAYAGISTFSSIYAKQIGASEVAAYFFVSYAIMLILSRPFVLKLFDRSGANTVIYPAFFILIVGIISLALAKGPFMFLASGAIIGVGNGTLFSSFQTMAVSLCPGNRSGVATSTYFLIYDTGMGLGAFILGMIAAHTNYHLMYFISALIVLISTLCYYTLCHRNINSIDNHMQRAA